MTERHQLTTELVYSNSQWRQVEQLKALISNAANSAYATACDNRGYSGPHELAINLSDDATIKQLNHSFRGKDKATNVLSFPYEDEFPELNLEASPLGDIILAYETIAREAEQQNKPLRHHIAHLVVHGVLHLFGYDHMNMTEAEEMEKIECDILATLQIPSPYRGG